MSKKIIPHFLEITVPISGFMDVATDDNNTGPFYTISPAATFPDSAVTSFLHPPSGLDLPNMRLAVIDGAQVGVSLAAGSPTLAQQWRLLLPTAGSVALIVPATHPDMCLQILAETSEDDEPLLVLSKRIPPFLPKDARLWSLFPQSVSTSTKGKEGTFYLHPQSTLRHITLGSSTQNTFDVVEFKKLSTISAWKFTRV